MPAKLAPKKNKLILEIPQDAVALICWILANSFQQANKIIMAIHRNAAGPDRMPTMTIPAYKVPNIARS